MTLLAFLQSYATCPAILTEGEFLRILIQHLGAKNIMWSINMVRNQGNEWFS